MREDDILYKQAVSNVRKLVDYVLDECDVFADEYNYDREWFMDRFREEFNKKRNKLN